LQGMKRTLLGLMTAALLPAVATAQTPTQPTRADVHAVIGWQNLHQEPPTDHYNDWLNAIFYGGVGAGWYWTDNLKAQIDFGAGTSDEQYRVRQVIFNGSPSYETSRLSVRQSALTLQQQYQFFHNQWFHPHVGAGVELARETTTERYDPVTVFDNVTRTSRTIQPARTEGPEHRFIARGVGEAGFKAYLTRRAFFTGDMRLMFRNGIDQVLFRVGFGVDF
jgi:opacity protein-like surface antigen